MSDLKAPIKPVRKAPPPPTSNSLINCMTHQNTIGQDPWDDLIYGHTGTKTQTKKKAPPRPPPPKIAPSTQIKTKQSFLSSKKSVPGLQANKRSQSQRSSPYNERNNNLSKPTATEACLINFYQPPSSPTGGSCSDGLSLNSCGSESNASNYSSGFDDNFDPFGPIPDTAKKVGGSSFFNGSMVMVNATGGAQINSKVTATVDDLFSQDLFSFQSTQGVNNISVKSTLPTNVLPKPNPAALPPQQANSVFYQLKEESSKNSTYLPPQQANSVFYQPKEESSKSSTRATIIRPKNVGVASAGSSGGIPHSASMPALGQASRMQQKESTLEAAPPLPPRPVEEVYGDDTPCAIALHQFDATDSGDLSLKEGQFVQLLYAVDEEWLYGRCGLNEGIFPKSFVQIKVALKEDKNSTCIDQKVVPSNYVTALYPFTAEMSGDLTIKEGDAIEVLGVVSEEWLYGQCNGNSGQFPANFVDRIPPNVPPYTLPK